LHQCQGFITCDLVNQPGESVPIDASAALRRAVEAIAPSSERPWDVRLLVPDVVGDVLASPQSVQSVFTAALEFLLSRATDNPVITVRVEPGIADIAFVLETADLSVSADEVRKVLVDDEATSAGQLRSLREVSDWVDQWGGRMVVSARDDQGIAIKLVLKRHRWLSDPRLSGAEEAKETGTQE
jgi:hypothetical protein